MRPKARSHRLPAALLAAGSLVYALFLMMGSKGLPCPFHALTGLYCPGCGVTRFCVALLRLDLAAAWRANKALCLISPLLCLLLGRRALRRPRRCWEEVLAIAIAAALLVFGVLRNLPAFSLLAPG